MFLYVQPKKRLRVLDLRGSRIFLLGKRFFSAEEGSRCERSAECGVLLGFPKTSLNPKHSDFPNWVYYFHQKSLLSDVDPENDDN